jgi:undecaprenyl-diphosphatase
MCDANGAMLEALDHHLFYLAYGRAAGAAHGALLWTMVALSILGSGWSMLAIAPLFASPRSRPFARSLTMVLVATAILVFATKALAQRVRPCACLADVHALFFTAPTDPSFPSGHAAGSFACALFLVIVIGASSSTRASRIALSLGVIVLACAIAFSRVYLGVHFPFDVFAGALLGGAIGVIGGKLHVAAKARVT